MGAESFQVAVAAARYAGTDLLEDQLAQLVVYRRWLCDEAIKAGGIGPAEERRLWNRHVADSLVFGIGLENAHDCIDIGTGVGLPGVPLAIAFPQISFLLLDRSGRRCDLVRRVIAILGLLNCEVRRGDINDVRHRYDAVVSRAAIPPVEMMIHVKRLLRTPGTAILGLSRVGDNENPIADEPGFAVSLVSVPYEVLDSEARLLRIEAT